MKTRSCLILTAFCISILLISCTKKESTSKPPNIVVIFSDELDPSYLGCYGGSFPTPNLDQLAVEGMQFTRAYSAASMCTPSRYGLLTGQYPGRCTHPYFLNSLPADEPCSIAWNTYIDSTVQTIARQLSKNGYRTGMAGKWHLGNLSGEITFSEVERDADPALPEIREKLQLFQKLVSDRVKNDAGFDDAASQQRHRFAKDLVG